jgi:hypothetical protein
MFSFLAGEPESDKRLLFKQTLKDLSQNRYVKFLRIKTEEADPSLALFLYSLYKTTFPIRVFTQDEEKMNLFRQKIVDAFVDLPLRETVRRLSPEDLARRAGTEAPPELISEIQADVDRLLSAFSREKMDSVNNCYNLAEALSQVVGFNFPGILKKFDPHFVGGNFSVEPRFSPVKMSLLYKDLEEFAAATGAITSSENWGLILELFKVCAGKELIQHGAFAEVIGGLQDVHESRIVEQMIQFYLRNPVWQGKVRVPNTQAAEAWLEAKKAEAKKRIDQIAGAQRAVQINALVKQIFTGGSMTRLENYTPARGEPFREKNLEDFQYAEGLNYLLIFLEEFVDHEMRELCDLLLIRGQWTNNGLSKDMSEAFYRLSEMPPLIREIDERMSEDGVDGSRLKAALLRVDRDKTQIRYINSIVGNNNDEALELINTAAQHFIVIGKHLRMLVEDIQRKPPGLLYNWKELISFSRRPLVPRLADDYKRINHFVQLSRLCVAAIDG